MVFKKFPSFDSLLREAVASFLRFPFTILSAFVAAGVGIAVIELGTTPTAQLLEKILGTCALGLPLFTGITLYAEQKGKSELTKLLFQGIGLVLLILYFLSLPQNALRFYTDPTRFVLISLTLHFLVSYLPYLRQDQAHGFWQYNKSLFLRFLTSVIYSGVLFGGLVIALAALNYLFDVKVNEHLYGELWVFMAFVVNTWIFLSGIPADLHALNTDTDYPSGLRVFAQYILLPLVALYLVILYFYEFKIIFQWNWPKGWVSQLILWYSAVGILAMLLLWPLREMTGSKWIRPAANWFFRFLIPLVVMLFLAIFRRISEYGITPPRYFVLVMAVGLAIVVLYFIFSRKKDIRIIPIILSFLALASAYGPWSAFEVSKRNQTDRLNVYIEKYELRTPVEQRSMHDTISIKDQQEMSSIIRYISDWHGASGFSAWLPDSTLIPLDTITNRSVVSDNIATLIGFTLLPEWSMNESGQKYFTVSADNDKEATEISKYQHLVPFQFVHGPIAGSSQGGILSDGNHCDLLVDSSGNSAALVIRTESLQVIDSFTFSFRDTLWMQSSYKSDKISQSKLTFDFTGQHYTIRMLLHNISGYSTADSIVVNNFVGQLLVGRR